jgi:hypothetical protein
MILACGGLIIVFVRDRPTFFELPKTLQEYNIKLIFAELTCIQVLR